MKRTISILFLICVIFCMSGCAKCRYCNDKQYLDCPDCEPVDCPNCDEGWYECRDYRCIDGIIVTDNFDKMDHDSCVDGKVLCKEDGCYKGDLGDWCDTCCKERREPCIMCN